MKCLSSTFPLQVAGVMRGHVIRVLNLMGNHEVKDSDTKLPTDQEQGQKPTHVKEGNRRDCSECHTQLLWFKERC